MVNIIAHLSSYVGIYFLNDYYPIFGISYVIDALLFIPLCAMGFQHSFRKNKMGKIKFVGSSNPIIAFRRYFPNANYKIGIILLVLFVYVFFNFFFSMSKLINGSPGIVDGKYILSNHGEMTEVDKKQYVEMCYTQLKLLSGHWIFFSVIPFISFLDRRKGGNTKEKNN
jgi:hypothetical protein